MNAQNKAAHNAEEFKGKAKEFIGDKTGNTDLAAEGRADQLSANVKQAGDHVKDAASDVKHAVNH